MESLFLLGFLMIFGSVFYLVYHFIRRLKNKERLLPKKKFYSVLIGGITAFVIGLSFTDTTDYVASKELRETNTLLLEENEEFQSKLEVIEEANNKLKESISVAEKDIEDLTLKLDEFDSIEQKLDDLETKYKEETEVSEAIITELEEKNTGLVEKEITLVKQVEELEQKNKSLESSASQTKTETSSNSSSKPATASNSTVKAESSTPKAESKSVEATQECSIKGSSSGIYHTPGSTYYNRTTSPVAMFCSVEEAKNAGYRAPKR